MVYDLIRLLIFRPRPGSPFSAYGGNYVLLNCDGVHVLLAHLRCGSIRVSTTDIVRAGDQLGEVGNSGSSIQPHLHLQVMENERLFPLFSNLLPFSLRTVYKRIGGEWNLETNASVMNGDHLRLEVNT
ncbi:M23 family metallopeptidase [Petrachloros mirabilis]